MILKIEYGLNASVIKVRLSCSYKNELRTQNTMYFLSANSMACNSSMQNFKN